MTSITDILAMEPRYAGANHAHAVYENGKFVGYKSNIAHINMMKDSKINAAKAIIGKKLAECLEQYMDYGGGYESALHDPGLHQQTIAALAEWNKLEGIK